MSNNTYFDSFDCQVQCEEAYTEPDYEAMIREDAENAFAGVSHDIMMAYNRLFLGKMDVITSAISRHTSEAIETMAQAYTHMSYNEARNEMTGYLTAEVDDAVNP